MEHFVALAKTFPKKKKKKQLRDLLRKKKKIVVGRKIPMNKYSKNTTWMFFFFQSKTSYVNHALFLFVVVLFQTL